MSCNQNFCMKFFTALNSKNIIAPLRIVTIAKSELAFLLTFHFHSRLFIEFIRNRKNLNYLISQHLVLLICVRERRQLDFLTLNGNLTVNGKDQFTILKTKSSHSSSIVVYPPKFEFLRN